MRFTACGRNGFVAPRRLLLCVCLIDLWQSIFGFDNKVWSRCRHLACMRPITNLMFVVGYGCRWGMTTQDWKLILSQHSVFCPLCNFVISLLKVISILLVACLSMPSLAIRSKGLERGIVHQPVTHISLRVLVPLRTEISCGSLVLMWVKLELYTGTMAIAPANSLPISGELIQANLYYLLVAKILPEITESNESSTPDNMDLKLVQ